MTYHLSSRTEQRNLSRRAALGLLGGTAVTAAFARLPSRAAARQETTPATGSTLPVLASSDPITIYDSGAALPTDSVTLQWLENGSGPRTVFMEDLFALYHEAHPNITVDYTHLPVPDQQQLLTVSLQAGNPPDVFQAAGITGAQLVREGWVAPLDEIVPDFAEWKAAFPANTFFEGINVFDGKTYTFPISTNQWLTTALLFNVAHMEQAGYDPTSAPLTWDEFRDAAKKITEQGDGQYYGFIIGGKQTERWGQIVTNLAEAAGAAGGELNWQTGEYNYTSDQFLAAIDLLLALNADGSVFPGSLQLSASQAREQFPLGVAGMILQGQWNIPQWTEGNPDFSFDVAFQPLLDAATAMPLTYAPGGANERWVSSQSELGTVAGDILHYLGSLDGQTAWGQHTRGSDPPHFTQAREVSAEDPRMQRVYDLTAQRMRLAPDPRVRNPAGAAQVYLETQSITPNLGETVQGIFTGQLSDPKAAMQDLQNRADAELERAIKAAHDNGAQVSRDDWVFPNWDPTRDYTEADYQAL